MCGGHIFGESGKKRSPSSVSAPNKHDQSRWPRSSTLGRVPRGNHATSGSTWTNFLVRSMQSAVATISRRFLISSWKLISVALVSFSGCATWFLISQPCFFQQPPTARIRVLDTVRVFEKLLDERRRPGRRVLPDLGRWLVNCSLEFFLLCFREFSISLCSFIISDSLLKRFVSVESLEPAVDRSPSSAVPLGKFGLRHAVLYAIAAKSRCVGLFPSASSSASWNSLTAVSSK